MSSDLTQLDEHILKLRDGGTLTENEVKALCEKVCFAATQVEKQPSDDIKSFSVHLF
jgi:hypothetical protein